MRKNGKMLIVVAVVVALAVEPAVAGRFHIFRRRRCCVVPAPCQTACAPPVAACSPCQTTPGDVGMNDDQAPIPAGPPAPMEGVPTPAVSESPMPTPAQQPGEIAQPFQPPVFVPRNTVPIPPQPAVAPAPSEPTVQSPPATPAVQPPSMPTPPNAPPAKPAAADDLFGDPAPQPKAPPRRPAKPAAEPDDLFGDPAPKSAAPAPKKPADAVDSLFENDDAAAPPKSAQMPATQKPAAAGDDLFGDVPARPAARPPVEEPASEPAPAVKPAAKSVADEDDLFGNPAGDAKKTAKPAAKPAAGDDDDLFGDPKDKTNKNATIRRSAPEAVVAKAPSDETASARSIATQTWPSSAPRKQPETISAAPVMATANDAVSLKGLRTWTDNTGKFQIRARLFAVLDGQVRLLKESGRFTTVPFERLSPADLLYVQQTSRLTAVSVTTGPAAPF